MISSIKFDPTISLSGILTLILILAFGWKIVRHMNIMEFKVDIMWQAFQKHFLESPKEGE
jgi:hypothetical protein